MLSALRPRRRAEAMKLNMFLPLLALLLLCFGVGNICASTVPDNSTDLLSLFEFKQAIASDPAEALSNWNRSTPVCQWKGVTCNPKNRGRVTALNLTGQELSGSISAFVGNLTFLHTLNLSNNRFSGQIPPLNNLHKLQVLDLSTNTLDGNIPDTLTNCSSLKILWLFENSLVGTIPPNIAHLSNLVNFDLSVNNLTGIIPPSIRNITGLTLLNLNSNQLSGIIPDELGELSNISGLELGENLLSGGIPAVLFNLSSLQVLSLAVNMLSKTLPPNMGDRLLSLQGLYLDANSIEGQIPSSLGNASRLRTIYLSSNNFSGPIPTSLGKLLQLSTLNLEKNNLEAWDNQSWKFLTTLRNCTVLKTLSLDHNNLQGVIPDSIGNLSPSLQNLRLDFNNLSGLIPPSIGQLHGLTVLTLRINNLTGTIGEWVGNLENLQVLNLAENNFIGNIPSSIGNFKQLFALNLAKNNLEGYIPSNLGNLQQLAKLNFSYNKLQGSIPEELLSLGQMRICTLSYNSLEGSIPLDLNKLQHLTELRLSSNTLVGEIPDSIGQCQSLQTIEIDQNFLTGNIPASLGNIVGLSILNLSHNNLSGTIPITLSSLRYLSTLDISFNQLHGAVPRNGVFANAGAVSLESNRGFCGGTMNLHLPSCRPTSSKRMQRQYYLIRVLIPIFGFMSLLLLVYFLLLEKKTTRREYLPSSTYDKQFPKVTYNDLAQATRNFSESNLVGRGSYGSVYRGKLKEPGMEMAVKVFNLEMPGAERSFLSECDALRSIQHRNLLPIVTACSTVDNIGNVFKALLYEFMPNGSLDTWLHPKLDGKAPKRLGLIERINIIVNIADVLDYLHHDCGRTTVHCDLKPSNILLDDDMNALLGDFGIASLYADSQLTSVGSTSSIGVKGTIGYIAPEYAGGGRHASTSGDVYSYGIVVLEMMTGKRPTDPIFKDGLDIVNFVSSNFPQQIFHVIDASLTEECKEFSRGKMESEDAFNQCFVSLLQVALSCTHPLPSERMNMKEIASKMHAIQASHVGRKAKTHATPEWHHTSERTVAQC